MKETYKKLASISIKGKTERKGNLDYLSWANAWHLLKIRISNSTKKRI